MEVSVLDYTEKLDNILNVLTHIDLLLEYMFILSMIFISVLTCVKLCMLFYHYLKNFWLW